MQLPTDYYVRDVNRSRSTQLVCQVDLTVKFSLHTILDMDTDSSEGFIAHSIKWVVDARGNSYGDERERLRYYESHSAMLTAQTYLIPVVSAIVILIFGKSAIAPILIVTAIPTLLAFYALIYLSGENVSLERNAFRKPWRAFWYFAAYLTLPLAILLKLNSSISRSLTNFGGSFLSFWIGVAMGLIIVVAVLIRRVASAKNLKK